MTYRVIVLYDGAVVLDAEAGLEEWVGFDQGLPGNIAVALNANDQEHPQRALLQQAIDSLPDSPGKDALAKNLLSLLPRDTPPVLCFSYDDPGPRKPDGSAVRSNIERVIEPGQAIPIAVSGPAPNQPDHEYLVVVEEVV